MRIRLLAALLALVSVILVVLVVPLGISNQRAERQRLVQRLERDAFAVSAVATGNIAPVPGAAGARRDAQLGSYLRDYNASTDARVVIVDAAGAEVADTDAPGAKVVDRSGRSFASRPEFRRALQGHVATGDRASRTLGYRLLYVAVPVASGGAVRGAARVSYPTKELDRRVREYWLRLGGISLAVLFAGLLLALGLARWVSAPLGRLAQRAHQVGEGDLSARAPTNSGPPEVREVAATFNSAVDALEGMVSRQREFVADASHQLRTPLQALTLRLENLRHDVNRLEGSDHALSAIDATSNEVDRLAGLVESLLVLERADAMPAEGLEAVDVEALVETLLDGWQALGSVREVGVRAVIPANLPQPWARERSIEQALANLVDNAVSVSPPDAAVLVTARADGDHVVLTVADEGPGMDDDEISRAFDRFHSSRAAGGGRGFGLGLAIVRRLVEHDGGSVTLARRNDGPTGLVATLRYPTRP